MKTKLLCLLLFNSFFVFAPIRAQPPTPTAPPTVISTPLIRDLTEATQALGILTVVVLALVLICVAIVVFFVIVVVRGGLKPLNDTVQRAQESAEKSQDARDKLQEQLFARLERGDKERAATAQLNERTANILSDLETKPQAEKARKDAVEVITHHIDNTIGVTNQTLIEVNEQLKGATEELKSVKETLPTKDDLKEHMDRVIKTVETALKKLSGGVQSDAPEISPVQNTSVSSENNP